MKFMLTKTREKIIRGLISGEYAYRKDDTRNWACYFFNISTKYVVIIGNETFPVSLEMIRLINDVKTGNLRYENGEFFK